MLAEAKSERSKEAVRMHFGFDGERMTYDAIGKVFERSSERMRQVVSCELSLIASDNRLFPLAARAKEAGLTSWSIDILARDGVDPRVVELAQADAHRLVEGINEGLRFLLECEGGCIDTEPCATCRSRALLEEHGLWEAVKEDAQRFYGHKKSAHDLPVSVLHLSVRTKNCLKNDSIKTLGQLVKKTAAELSRFPNMGRKSLAEVEEKLQRFGLTLRGR